MTSRTVAILHGMAATILAVGLLFASAATADELRLPFIHSWALMHGSIFFVFPVYFLLSHVALRPVARRLQGGPHQASVPTQHISLLAISSLLLSGSGFLIPFVGSVLGIATGHIARRRCRANAELSGSGFAVAGLVLGYLGLAYSFYAFGMVSWVASRHSS